MDLDPGLPTVNVDTTATLNGVLSALADVNVDLGTDEHLALVDADIALGDLLAKLRVEVGSSESDNILDVDVSVPEVLHAMASVATDDGNLAAAAAINSLMLDLDDMALGDIQLGDLFHISDMSLIDGVNVDLLDVTINMLSLWNQHHMVAPTTINIDGDLLDLDADILSAQVDIDIQSPPQVMIGPDDISAEMGNVEIQVHAKLADIEANLDAPQAALVGAKLVLGQIDLCVFAPWVSARADVLDDENGAAMLDADVGRISMCIGKVVPGAIGEGSDEIVLEEEVEPSIIGQIVVWIAGHEVPIATVKARALATVEAHADAIAFNGDSANLLHLDFGTTEAALFEQLFANIEITVEPLGLGLTTIQLNALQNATGDALLDAFSLPDLLHDTVLPTLDVLGSGLTGIDLNVGDLIGGECGILGGGDGDGDGIDVDVDVDADVDVSVDEDIDVSVDTDTDVGVDVDMDGDDNDGHVDADVDVDVDADDDGVSVDADGNVHADVGDTMADVNANADGRLNLAGGGCSVGGPSNRSTSGLSSLALLGLVLALRARRKATRD